MQHGEADSDDCQREQVELVADTQIAQAGEIDDIQSRLGNGISGRP